MLLSCKFVLVSLLCWCLCAVDVKKRMKEIDVAHYNFGSLAQGLSETGPKVMYMYFTCVLHVFYMYFTCFSAGHVF